MYVDYSVSQSGGALRVHYVWQVRPVLCAWSWEKARGLMHRRSLAPDGGMLFIYTKELRQSMWMKNTLIPLDMLFIRQNGRIAHIHERAVPGSLATISSRGRVLAVLELRGGTVARLGIRKGDRVVHSIFDY